MPDPLVMNGKLLKSLIAIAVVVGTWWVGRVMGATDRLLIVETKVASLEQQLDRIEGKLDRALEVRHGGKGDDGLRILPGPVPKGSPGPVRKLP